MVLKIREIKRINSNFLGCSQDGSLVVILRRVPWMPRLMIMMEMQTLP